jgi:hypothetical protein
LFVVVDDVGTRNRISVSTLVLILNDMRLLLGVAGVTGQDAIMSISSRANGDVVSLLTKPPPQVNRKLRRRLHDDVGSSVALLLLRNGLVVGLDDGTAS